VGDTLGLLVSTAVSMRIKSGGWLLRIYRFCHCPTTKQDVAFVCNFISSDSNGMSSGA
jgi:hypothetical protein